MSFWCLFNLNEALIKIFKHHRNSQQAWAEDLKFQTGL